MIKSVIKKNIGTISRLQIIIIIRRIIIRKIILIITIKTNL